MTLRLLDRLPQDSDLSDWQPFDETDSRSLINIAPHEMRETIRQVPKDWLLLTETELRSFMTPDPFLCRLRLAFWAEYERAQMSVTRMDTHRIALMLGSVSKIVVAHFRKSENAAWILCPPASYEMYLDEALSHGLRRLREEILEMPIKDPVTNRVDTEAANLLLKAIAFVDMRKNGGIVQKNLNIHTSTKDLKKLSQQLTLDEINARIKELEQQGTVDLAREAARIPEVID